MGLLRKLFAPSKSTNSNSRVVASPIGLDSSQKTLGRADRLLQVNASVAGAPDDPELLFARAEVLLEWGRYREAVEGYLRAEAAGCRGAALESQLGLSYFHVGDGAQAEARMRRAIAAEPDSAVAHVHLGTLLRALGQREPAAAVFERAVALDPKNYDALIELGNCRIDQRDLPGGESLFRRAIEVDGGRAVGWQNLGVSLQLQDRLDEAKVAIARAVPLDEREGGDLESFVNLAVTLDDDGQREEALALYERNLPRLPSAYGHFTYALALLGTGRLEQGWHHQEFRWLNEPLRSMRFRARTPAWAGQDLGGKTIRLRVEQGIGDVIQFIRYAPMLKALGASVHMASFHGLTDSFPGIDRVIREDEPIQPFDYYVNLLSLPRVFGTDLSSVPANVPYIAPHPDKAAQWAARLPADEHSLKVGLVWAGNPGHRRDRHRSIALCTLGPLGEVRGVRWFALQKGASDSQAVLPPDGFDWTNLAPALGDFGDTAAAISQLDLVLCVDTAVAHLAGAMGKPVWVMIAQPADWRWLEDREDTPWYPTMRLFRQQRRDDWDEVVGRVRQALIDAANTRTLRSAPALTPQRPSPAVSRVPLVSARCVTPGCRPGFSAVTETRSGIVQYLPDEGDAGRSIAWYGEWMQLQMELLGRIVAPGTTVLEMGAGFGAHSLFLSNAIGRSGHLILHESRPLQHRILRGNLAANAVANATLLRPAPDTLESTVTETVDELQLERLDWLKMSAAETAMSVLQGASATLWQLRPLWMSAAADQPMLESLADFAKEHGYRSWRIETALFNPGNFNNRRDDIFSGRTALALIAIPEEIDVGSALDGCVELP